MAFSRSFRMAASPVAAVLASAVVLLTTACASNPGSVASAVPAVAGISGKAFGGSLAISGAAVQLYGINPSGTANAPFSATTSTALLTKTVTTGADGSFSISTDYTCPAPPSYVYITVTGGNPGLPAGTTNSVLGLETFLGLCSGLSTSTYITINEVTTIGAAFALENNYGTLTGLAAATTLNNQLVNTYQGTPGGAASIPSGYNIQAAAVNFMADIITPCVNSTGVYTVGDKSACDTLLSSVTATPYGKLSYSNTLTAAFGLASATSISHNYWDVAVAVQPQFTPSFPPSTYHWCDTQATPNCEYTYATSLAVLSQGTAPTISLPSGTYTGAQTVILGGTTYSPITGGSQGGTLLYTTDGSTPNVSPLKGTLGSTSTQISVAASETVKVMQLFPNGAYGDSTVTSATYTIK